MSELTKLERVELRLMDAAQKARREGFTIISGDYIGEHDGAPACCPIYAYGSRVAPNMRLGTIVRFACKALGLTFGQQAALIDGFDGQDAKNESCRSWFAMGRRLRRALNPVPLVGAA